MQKSSTEHKRSVSEKRKNLITPTTRPFSIKKNKKSPMKNAKSPYIKMGTGALGGNKYN